MCGFSAPVVFRSKARREANGGSIVECCNAAAGHHRHALRVSLSTPTDGVAPLGKGITIDKKTTVACEAAPAVNVDKLTEPAITRWIEH